MTRVAVVGGGTAGYEAAAEASRNHAEVTLLERSDYWEPSWNSWPDLILSSEQSEGPPALLDGIELVYDADVTSVGPGSVMTADGKRVRFDSVVLTTGGEFISAAFLGRRKRGVVILDGTESYTALGRERSSMSRVVLQGEGIHAFQVADRLSGAGRKVTLLAAPWMESFTGKTIGDAIKDVAAERGISVVNSKLERAVGCEHVEAVITGGAVLPCDNLAVLPGRWPHVPRTSAETGPKGGLFVDEFLRSSCPLLYAAGWCAEPRNGWPNPYTLEVGSAMSGRVAGANATGQRLALRRARFAEASFFGLRWARAWAGLWEARGPGHVVSEISRRWSPESACSISYERPSGKILGIELVIKEGSERLGIFGAITSSSSLRAAAYGVSGDSSDISLVSDTARLGLEAWSGS